MSTEQRKCPYCGMAMAADQRTCPDCGNPYPFDNDAAEEQPEMLRPLRTPTGDQPDATRQMRNPAGPDSGPGERPSRTGSRPAGGGVMGLITQYRTALVLVGVLVGIVVVGYLLFSVAMRYFESGRPEPGSAPNATPAPVLVPSPVLASPGPLASPSPGTLIQPSASPSPVASGVKMKIANTDGQGANMRQRPSTTAPVLRTLPDGTSVEVIGSETTAEGRAWRNIRDPGGATGWVASELLGPE